MDEKTAELRDIFVEVTDEETVTESQEESPGSLADRDEADEERLAALVGTMRERCSFETELADGTLVVAGVTAFSFRRSKGIRAKPQFTRQSMRESDSSTGDAGYANAYGSDDDGT